MSTTDDTNAARRGSESNDLLGFTVTDTPLVNACIQAVMAKYPGHERADQRYYYEVHQVLAPLARELEREHEAAEAALDVAAEEVRRLRAELAEWNKLRDPANLHVNLLRGLPAQLTREQAMHLCADDLQRAAGLEAEVARLRAGIHAAMTALDYHTEQTRPIAATEETIEALARLLKA